MVRYVGPCVAEVIAEYPDVVATHTLANAGRAQVWLVGPGLGQDKDAKQLLKSALELPVPLVIDADGLNLLASKFDPKVCKQRLKNGEVTLLTPHQGEAARLLVAVDEAGLLREGRVKAAQGLANTWHSVVVLKGPGTVVAAPKDDVVWVDRLGDQTLATAGSGDVLGGLLAGLMAHRIAGVSKEGLADIDWAELGAQAVAWHAIAAKQAVEFAPAPVTSTDLLGYLNASPSSGSTAHVQIDSQAIKHNVDVLVQAAGNAEVMAVVKANAYGHGLVGVSKLARSAGASWLGVAQLHEALQLRAAGDAGPILAWLPVPEDDFAACVTQDIDLGLSSTWALSRAAEASRLVGKPAKVHLKIDTGLGRAGATPQEWESLVAMALGFEAEGTMRITGIWSHFALADAPGDKTIAKQLEVFAAANEAAKAMGVRDVIKHIANSAATLSLPSAHFDLVRPGIAIYGISPGEQVGLARDFDLVPAMKASTSVSMVKRVKAGTGLSYGHEYKTEQDANVVVVPMGYADGLPRNATNCGPLWCAGGRRTISGRVCMDQFVVDIGDATAQAGDEVVLFGNGSAGEPTADDWANATSTIAYEIVTQIAPRAGREFR
jgi:alanine racemase